MPATETAFLQFWRALDIEAARWVRTKHPTATEAWDAWQQSQREHMTHYAAMQHIQHKRGMLRLVGERDPELRAKVRDQRANDGEDND